MTDPYVSSAGRRAGRVAFCGWAIAVAAGVFLLVGYEAYRSDHMTHVPMLLRLQDPSLFERDWFFGGEGHYLVRDVYLDIQRVFLRVIPSLPAALYLQTILYLTLYVAALGLIARRLGRSQLFATFWILAAAVLNKTADVADLEIFRDQAIPSNYGYLASIWAIWLLLDRRALWAGLLLGAAGWIQAAVTLQFLIIFACWRLFARGLKAGGLDAAKLFGGFIILYLPQLLRMRGLVDGGEGAISEAEYMHWLAYVRHPHHMLPHHLGFANIQSLLGVGVAALLALISLGRSAWIRPVVHLLLAFVLWIGVSLILIYPARVPMWVAFQPMRVWPFFSLLCIFLIMSHISKLATRGTGADWARGAVLYLALISETNRAGILLVYCCFEAMAMILDRTAGKKAAAAPVALGVLALGWFSWKRAVFAAGLAAAGWIAMEGRALVAAGPRKGRLSAAKDVLDAARRPAWRAAAWALAGAAGAAIWIALWLIPFQEKGEDPRQWSAFDRYHYRFAMRYQARPFPTYPIERAGVWAGAHTPKSALFIIPPERNGRSFQIWSRRAAVFNGKTFPFSRDEIWKWIERIYAHYGVMEPAVETEAAAAVKYDFGSAKLNQTYSSLSPKELLEIADCYGADYIIHTNPGLETPGRLIQVAGPFNGPRFEHDLFDDRFSLSVYKVE